MKNQYVGDVNDFCKYGLLRALTERGLRSMTVAWMLTPDDASADGRKLAYLKRPDRWRWRDPDLFDALSSLVADGQARSVTTIEASGVLGGARFAGEPVPRSTQYRGAYFDRVLQTAAGCELLFFDPDNGLEVASRPPGRQGSDKYLLWAELGEAYTAGHSVLVYQHFPRRRRDHFIAELAARIGERTGASRTMAFATPGVVFLLAVQPSAEEYYGGRGRAIADEWRGVIEVIPTHAPRGDSADQ